MTKQLGGAAAPRTPGVTVVLPALHADEWLRAAIESILEDGYPSLTVLVVLDGHTSVPEVPWLHVDGVRAHPMGARVGIARALNEGVALANTEFIARMDGDDISLPGRFSAQIESFIENPRLAVVGCPALRMNEDGRVYGALDVPVGPAQVKRQLLTKNALIHPSVMLRRESFLAVGGYDERALTSEDYDLYLRLAVQYDLDNLPTPYLHYRIHDGQVTRAFNPFTRDKLRLLSRRRTLARTLGVSIVAQLARDIVWYAAQAARYMGLRSTG